MVSTALKYIGSSDDQTVLTDTLNVWLQRAAQLHDLQLHDVALSDSCGTDLFNYVCDFWTDSGVALGSALRELFVKLLALLTKLRDQTSLSLLLNRWTERVLTFSRTMRIFYFTLETLLQHTDGNLILKSHPTIVQDAFVQMSSNALANPVAKMILAFVKSTAVADGSTPQNEQWLEYWSVAILQPLFAGDSVRNATVTYFLPHFFSRFPQFFPIVIAKLKLSDRQSYLQTIGVLRVGQDLGLYEVGSDDIVSLAFLEDLLHREDQTLRVGAFSILVSSPQGSKPIPLPVLELLIRNFDVITDSDAGYRNEMNGLIRNFISRIRGYAYAEHRELTNLGVKLTLPIDSQARLEVQESVISHQTRLDQLEVFCRSLITALQSYLRPGTPYFKLTTATITLTALIKSGIDHGVDQKFFTKKQFLKFPFSIAIFSPSMRRLLIDNVANNYDDIRAGSSNLLQMAPPGLLVDELDSLTKKAFLMMKGARGREGNAGAHILKFVFNYKLNSSVEKALDLLTELICILEHQVIEAKRDYTLSAHEDNIHGTFTSLCYIYESINLNAISGQWTLVFSDLVTRGFTCCISIWKIVEPILTQDAPEGSIYEENLDSQSTLSYAWRAIRESTNLQRVMLDRFDSEYMLPDEIIVQCGDVLLNQLANIRHRGAFSSVHPTLISCCIRCLKRPKLSKLPDIWLQSNLELVESRSQNVTRRSGGLPFLITAVLSAEVWSAPSRPLGNWSGSTHMQSTFEKLISVARTPVVENEAMDYPQVHAFNCIKAIVIDTRLSAYCGFMIDSTLDLAISSFQSPVWSIRNCAVMLFTALQNRLFGTRKAISAKLFFSRYKTVRSLLLKNFQQSVSQINQSEQLSRELLFPSLAVLSRLQAVSDYSGLQDFQDLVIQCLGCREWKIREMAARALAHITHQQEVPALCTRILSSASISHQNDLHGKLLAVLEMTQTHSSVDSKTSHGWRTQDIGMETNSELAAALTTKFDEFATKNECAETRLLYLRVLKLFPASDSLISFVSSICDTAPDSSLHACKRCLRAEAIEFKLKIDPSTDFICHCLRDKSYECQLMTLRYLRHAPTQSSLNQLKIFNELKSLAFDKSTWDHVRGPALNTLCHINAFSQLPEDELRQMLTFLFNFCIRSHTSNEAKESAVESLGAVAGRLGSIDPEATNGFVDLIMSSFAQDASTRRASLLGLIQFLRGFDGQPPSNVMVCLFKFLSDDDAQIREIAAEAHSDVYAVKTMSISSCENHILAQLPSDDLSIPLILHELGSSVPIRDQLESASHDNQELFMEEKENLFIDDLVKTDQYTVFIREIFVKAAKQESNQICSLVHEAYSELIRFLRHANTDGNLGWSSNPPLFQVLYKTRLLIELGESLQILSDIGELLALQEKLQYHESLCVTKSEV